MTHPGDVAPDPGLLQAAPARDVAAVSASCQARILEREGIAMFLAVHDARPGRQLRVTDPVAAAEGRRLAQLFDHYRAGLVGVVVDNGSGEVVVEGDTTKAAPGALDPTGAVKLIDILVVLSDQHLLARPAAGAGGAA